MFLCLCVVFVFVCWTGLTIMDTSALHLKCSASVSLISWYATAASLQINEILLALIIMMMMMLIVRI